MIANWIFFFFYLLSKRYIFLIFTVDGTINPLDKGLESSMEYNSILKCVCVSVRTHLDVSEITIIMILFHSG